MNLRNIDWWSFFLGILAVYVYRYVRVFLAARAA